MGQTHTHRNRIGEQEGFSGKERAKKGNKEYAKMINIHQCKYEIVKK